MLLGSATDQQLVTQLMEPEELCQCTVLSWKAATAGAESAAASSLVFC